VEFVHEFSVVLLVSILLDFLTGRRFFSDFVCELNLDVEVSFKVEDKSDIFSLEEKDVESFLALSGGPARPVDEAVLLLAVEVDDYIDVVNVQASRGDVSADQDVASAFVSVFVECVFSLVLLQVSVDGQELCKLNFFEFPNFSLCLCENYDLLVLVGLDELLDVGHFVFERVGDDGLRLKQ